MNHHGRRSHLLTIWRRLPVARRLSITWRRLSIARRRLSITRRRLSISWWLSIRRWLTVTRLAIRRRLTISRMTVRWWLSISRWWISSHWILWIWLYRMHIGSSIRILQALCILLRLC